MRATARRPTPRSVFGPARERECRDSNLPTAASVRRALNRSDAVPTNHENLSPSAVLLLADRGQIGVRQRHLVCEDLRAYLFSRPVRTLYRPKANGGAPATPTSRPYTIKRAPVG